MRSSWACFIGPVLRTLSCRRCSTASPERRGIFARCGRLQPSAGPFYNYTGSKTTPPCQEPVEWVVMQDAETVSPEQLRALQAFSGGPNNRPLQPLRGRRIALVDG